MVGDDLAHLVVLSGRRVVGVQRLAGGRRVTVSWQIEGFMESGYKIVIIYRGNPCISPFPPLPMQAGSLLVALYFQ